MILASLLQPAMMAAFAESPSLFFLMMKSLTGLPSDLLLDVPEATR
ncbi:MAG: hypothetical protein WC123_06620 [Bacilli bacterium]